MVRLREATCFTMATSWILLSRFTVNGAVLRTVKRSHVSRSSFQMMVTASRPIKRDPGTAGFASDAPASVSKLNCIEFNPEVSLDHCPVIIMHGLLGNSRNFQTWGGKLIKMLERPRRVYAVDMRNHGTSSHCPTMTYPDMAADIVAFMKDKGLKDAVLIGHSMGGKTACATALKYPDKIAGLVCMDISPVSYSVVDQTNWGETQRIISAIAALNLSGVKSRRDADALLEKDIVDPMLRAFAVTNLEKVPGEGDKWEWRINVPVINKSMSALAQFEGLVGCAPYPKDTLFIAGGKSRYIRSVHLPAISILFPRFSLRTLPNAGHWCHTDDPTGTLESVKLYLDRPEQP